MKINEKGLSIIKFFEGFKSNPYLCPANIWTIGWGSTKDLEGKSITENHPQIDKDTAEKYLLKGIEHTYKVIEDSVEVDLNENQFSALVSFIYNVGAGNFKRSTLLKKLNAGDLEGVKEEFPKWRIAKGRVLQGLVNRREEESKLFFS